ILGDDGPAVGELADAWLAGVDHRLDGEGHARLQAQPGLRPSVVEHLRLLVELAADAVPAEFPHHRKAVALGVRLNGVPDVAQVSAWAHSLNAEPHALVSCLTQAARLDRGLADI